MPLTSDLELRTLLENAKHIAVVGYSDDPSRPSHQIAHMLQSVGYHVSAVNPTLKSSANQPGDGLIIYPTLADVPQPVDIVDVFRRPEFLPGVVDEAIAIDAKAVWMQLGIVNHEAAQHAETAGLQVVMDRCIKVVYWQVMGTH